MAALAALFGGLGGAANFGEQRAEASQAARDEIQKRLVEEEQRQTFQDQRLAAQQRLKEDQQLYRMQQQPQPIGDPVNVAGKMRQYYRNPLTGQVTVGELPGPAPETTEEQQYNFWVKILGPEKARQMLTAKLTPRTQPMTKVVQPDPNSITGYSEVTYLAGTTQELARVPIKPPGSQGYDTERAWQDPASGLWYKSQTIRRPLGPGGSLPAAAAPTRSAAAALGFTGGAAPPPRWPTMAVPAPQVKGLITPGNIPIWNRPVIQNANGTSSTEFSVSAADDEGHEVLLPTIVDGRFLTPDGTMPKDTRKDSPEMKALTDAAWKHYEDTGENLGVFDNAEDANNYANVLHSRSTMPRPAAVAPGGGGTGAGRLPRVAAPAGGLIPSPGTPTAQGGLLAQRGGAVRAPGATLNVGTYHGLTADGDIPDHPNVPGGPWTQDVVQAARNITHGMNPQDIKPPNVANQGQVLAGYFGWKGIGSLTPKEQLRVQEADKSISRLLDPKSGVLRVLDDPLQGRLLAQVYLPQPETPWGAEFRRDLIKKLSPEAKELRIELNQLTSLMGGFRQFTGGGVAEAQTRRYTAELPDPLTTPDSNDARRKLMLLRDELNVAKAYGYFPRELRGMVQQGTPTPAPAPAPNAGPQVGDPVEIQ